MLYRIEGVIVGNSIEIVAVGSVVGRIVDVLASHADGFIEDAIVGNSFRSVVGSIVGFDTVVRDLVG